MVSISLLKFLLLQLLSIVPIYAMGVAFTNLFGLRMAGYFQHFVRLCAGLSIIIILYAAVSTNGNTVMLLLAPALAGLGFSMRQMQNTDHLVTHVAALQPVSILRLSFLLVIGAIVLFIMHLPLVVDTTNVTVGVPYDDYVFYSKLTYPLCVQGVESGIIEPRYVDMLSPQPYHYYEIWINAWFVEFTGLPSVLLLTLVTYPLLVLFVLLGLAALVECYFDDRWLILALAASALFIMGLDLTALPVAFIKLGMKMRTPSLLYHPKEAPIFLFLVLGFILFKRKFSAAAIWAWACIPVVYISTLPAMITAVPALALYLYWRRLLTFKNMALMVMPLLAVVAGIGLFYGLNGMHKPSLSTTQGFAAFLIKPEELLTGIHIMGGNIIIFALQYSLYFLLIFILLFVQRQHLVSFFHQNESEIIFLLILYSSGITIATMTFHFINNYQFLTNLMLPALVIVLTMLIAAASADASYRQKQFAVGGLFLIVCTGWLVDFVRSEAGSEVLHYDKKFVAQVKQLAPALSQKGAFVMDDKEYISVMKMHTSGQTPGVYLSLFRNNQPLISLSQLDVDSIKTDPRFVRDSIQVAKAITQSTIYQFVQEQKRMGKYSDLAHAKQELVLQEKINFICLSPKGQVPNELRARVVTVLVDPVSKEKLCLLRTE